MNFGPCNCPLKIWESFTLSYLLGSMKCDSLASLLTHTIASPYLGHEPKARIVTKIVARIKTKCFKIKPLGFLQQPSSKILLG
jgi:hypothetical protein